MRMPISGQQLGSSPIAIPVATGSSSEESNGSALPPVQRTEFSEGPGNLSTAGTELAPRTPPRPGFRGLQREPRLTRGPGERPADDDGTRLSHHLASRPYAISIESMARRLLTNGRVLAARKLVGGVPSDHVANETLRRLRAALAEPVVRRRLPAEGKGSRNIEWLRRHAHRHAGQWVALVEGELVDTDASLAVLRRRLRQLAPGSKALLHRL